MTFKSNPGGSDSKLTEFEVIVRFVSLAERQDDFEIDGVDLPTDDDIGETEMKFVNRVSTNTHYGESEVQDMVSDPQDPDIVGSHNSRPLHAEAKGGNKVPNNVSHELGYVLMKNIKIGTPMESSIVIPRDRAIKSKNRLTNKHESTKDKAGLEGYKRGVEVLENKLDAKYKVYVVWNDIVEMRLSEFLASDHDQFSKEREKTEDIKPLRDLISEQT